MTNYVLVVKGSVPDMMGVQVDQEKFPMEYLREISRSRIGVAVTIGDLARTLASRGADPVMGLTAVAPPPPGAPASQRPGLRLIGTALFRDDKLVDFMDEHITRGLLWLRGEIQRGIVSVDVPDSSGHVAIEWVRSNVSRRAELRGGRIVIHVIARTEGAVSENSAHLDLADPSALTRVNQLFSRDIRLRMELALKQMHESGVDSAGFGELVHQQLPAVWKRVEKRWRPAEFRRAKVVLEVDARVRRTGLSGKPRGVREDELTK